MNTPSHLFNSLWQNALRGNASRGYVIGENRRIDAVASALAPGERLLDIGCGTGTLSLAIKHKFGEVHGIDVAEPALAVARNNGMIARLVDLNAEPLPYRSEFFDVLTLLAVLPYLYDPNHVLRECYRVLRPGGKLFLGAANLRTVPKLLKIVIQGRFPTTSKGVSLGYDGGAMHYFCSGDLHALLRANDFTVVRTSGIHYRPQFLESTLARMPILDSLVREFFAGEVVIEAARAAQPTAAIEMRRDGPL